MLVALDGLPVVDETRHTEMQAQLLCQNVLRWLGDLDYHNLSKIYMPQNYTGTSFGSAITAMDTNCMNV